ncbi:MAG: protein kinase [Candidatus Melainabacteria bacterium]|nr:protein kinase [Candidatus Melainabacteria bacterium]
MAKIVVVEDDISLAELVRDFLEHEGNSVTAFHNGLEGQNFILASQPDLIILDWDLPGLNGIEILRDYRGFGGKSPVIMLTGHHDVEDKEKGFDEGADDYLTKPFNLKELGARVRGLLRRSKAVIGNVVTVGDIVVDLDTSKVLKSGRNVTLVPREFQLLSYLVKNRNEALTHQELLDNVWTSDAEMTAEALNNVVRRLSKKLDPDGRILRINVIMGSADYRSMNGSNVGASGLDGIVDDRSDRGDPLIGRVLDNKYEIIKAIGGGASGQVYKAKHRMLNITVAVKVLAPQLSTQPDLVRRFEREARAAGLLSHKNVLIVHDLGVTEESQPYMVMEYLNGFSLAELLEQNGKLALPDAVEIVSQICLGIGKAHEEGLVHRDLKPGNIMLVAEGDQTYTVKIVDFGLAKSTKAEDNAPNLTQTGALIGTPSYMSPEQCRSEPTDHRCDIYAIGCMLYEMLTGEVPFVSSNIIETFIRHAQESPPLLTVADLDADTNTRLEAIVHRCLAKEKESRYQSASQLLVDLSKLSVAVK